MYKSKKVKLICLTMAVFFMFAAVISGCGKQKEPSNGQNTGTSTAGTSASNQDTAPKLDPVELTWYVVNTPQKDTELVVAEVNKMLKEKINATLKYSVVDWGAYEDKMKVTIAAGEPFDLCFTASWSNNFNSNVQKGGFLALDALLDKYGKSVKSLVPAKYMDAVKFKGEIYAVPNYQGYAIPRGYTLKKDLVEKYNFDYKNVKKLGDFEPFLEAVKKGEPEITPFLASKGQLDGASNMDYTQTASPNDTLGKGISIDTKTFKVFNPYEGGEGIAGYKLLRSWYEKGYIKKDSATVKDYNAEAKTGKYAMLVTGGIYDEDGTKSTKDKGFACVDVPLYTPMINTNAVQAGLTAISKTSKNPERAMMLIDLMYSDKEIYNTLGFGLEGKHYTKLSEDTINTIDNSGYGSYILYELGPAFNKYYTKEEGPEFIAKQKEGNEKGIASPILGFTYDGAAMKNQNAQISAIISEYLPLLNTGSANVDEILPTMVDRMKKAGIDEVLADAQKQVDEWRKVSGK